jgi:hypothetical protein
LTVAVLKNSCAAIAGAVMPAAMSPRISRSREVRTGRSPATSRAWISVKTPDCSDGSRTFSPRATAAIAPRLASFGPVAGRARCHRGVDHRARLGSGEHEDPRGRAVARERFDHVDAPQARHAHVEHGDVGGQLAGLLQRAAAVGGSGQQLQVGPGRDGLGERVAVERVVVGDDDGRPRMVAEHAPIYARVEPVRIDVRVTRTPGSR